jgi:uncharacterized protein with HEPN domain
MRREELYLRDIAAAAEAIAEFVKNRTWEQFVNDDQLQSSVMHKLMIIGEAASKLPGDFCARYPDVEWSDIIGFRNIIVHEYFSVRWPVVWATATGDVPMLRQENCGDTESRVSAHF